MSSVTARAREFADPSSALHASCVTMRAAGARLLARAQAEGKARTDIDGADLFAWSARSRGSATNRRSRHAPITSSRSSPAPS